MIARILALALLLALGLPFRPLQSAALDRPPTSSASPSAVGAPGVPDSPGGSPQEGAHVVSALVRLAGPDVHDAFVAETTRSQRASASSVLASAEDVARQLRVADGEVRAQQSPVAAAAQRLGIDVVSRYTTVANALLVHGTPRQLEELSRTPGVVSIEPAPRVRLALERSVAHIGADALAEQTGYLGAGSVVAVIDTGIDYTHAAFGGPGTPDAYAFARAHAETIDDEWEGKPLFPTERVVGGYDFVGPNYTTPELCPPEMEQAGACTSTPHPDPDPLDEDGHGTNTAGVIGGQATAALSRGVAPEAGLVALKIYGPPRNRADTDETVDILIDAIEWCVRVNLGLDVPGTVPPPPLAIDVLNMSIGEPYAQGSRLFDEVIDAALDAGIVVVAAAGNDGDRPYVLSAPGASPRALSVASVSIGVDDASDTMAGHSARGPSKNSALKPDIAAPGAGVFTASLGSGDGGRAASGTSISSPHVAGAAALLRQRDRAEDLELTAPELAAMLMNYTRPMLSELDGRAQSVPITRQGAGRLDVLKSGTADLVVTAGDIASLNLGPMSLTEKTVVEKQFEVKNLGEQAVFFELASSLTDQEAHGTSVTVTLPEGVIPLGPKKSVQVPVRFEVDPAALGDWTLRGVTPISLAAFDALEIGGAISVNLVDSSGNALPDTNPARVPFWTLPRAASRVRPEIVDRQQVTFENASDFPGDVELFVVPFGGTEDPDEDDVRGEIDVRSVGVRFEPGAGGETFLTFGIALHEISVVPQVTQYEFYIDLDRDGYADKRVRTANEGKLGDLVSVKVADWDSDAGQIVGDEQSAGLAAFDVNTRIAVVAVPLSALGLDAPRAFDFYLISRGLTEDWWDMTNVDIVPNDVDGPCGRVLLRVEPERWSGVPSQWTFTVEPGGKATARRDDGHGDIVPRLMALLPDNRFEDANAQLAVLVEGSDPDPVSERGRCQAFLPIATKAFELKPLAPPDAMIAKAIEDTAAISELKMIWDRKDGAVDEGRKFRFRGPVGLLVTYSPRHAFVPGQPRERMDVMRIENTAWARRHVNDQYIEDWHCHPITPDLMFWPEFVRVFQTEFPRVGWRIEGQSPYEGRTTWLLRNTDSVPGMRFAARVDVDTGLLALMSRVWESGAYDVFKPYEFNVPNDYVAPIRNVPCP